MNRLNRILLLLISMTAVMLAAVGIDHVYQNYRVRIRIEERQKRNEATQARVNEIEVRLAELSADEEAIKVYIAEKTAGINDLSGNALPADGLTWDTVSSNSIGSGDISGNSTGSGDISGNSIGSGDISGNSISSGGISGNSISSGDISGNSIGSGDVSGNSIPEGDISGNSISESNGIGRDISGNSLSGNELSPDYMSYAGVSENGVTDNAMDQAGMTDALTDAERQAAEILARRRNGKLTLQERQFLQGSYMETVQINKADKKVIAENNVDFTDLSIACLGDSLTAASNLETLEDYRQYSYPTRLQDLLDAREVTNLGIGGSSIGRYWDQPFVERYRDIPEDTDIILVMGGTNDGFCAGEEELGTLEERARDTFTGDLDELMKGLQEDYPDTLIVFATPLPNVLHDILRGDKEELLPQKQFADIISQLGAEHQIPVIDLYNSNLLDSHDAANIYNYLPDGVHCNPAGYEILAEHFAAELIKITENSDR